MINKYYSDILGMNKGGATQPKYSIKKEVKDRLKKENPKTNFLMFGLSPVTQYRKFKHRQNIKKERARDEAKVKMKRGGDVMPARNKKNFRSTKSGAGMTQAGVMAYRRKNPGSKAANRRKSYCARSAGQMKKFPKAAANPNSRLRQARRRWKC